MPTDTTTIAAPDRRLIDNHERSLVTLGRSPKTIASRVGTLRRLAVWLAEHDLTLGDATPRALAEWQATLSGLLPESRRSYTCHVRSFYQWRAQFTGDDPSITLQVPKVAKGRPRPIAEDDLTLTLRTFSEPHRTWVLLAAYLGLRAGEVAAISRDDIQDGKPPLLTVHGKGNKTRLLPIPGPVMAALRPYLHHTGPLWRRPSGGQLTGDHVSHLMAEEFRAIGLPYTLHNCRHRLGTELYRTVKDIRLVQEVLGHSSPATTAIYTQVATQATVKGLNRVSRGLSSRRAQRPAVPDGDVPDGDGQAA